MTLWKLLSAILVLGGLLGCACGALPEKIAADERAVPFYTGKVFPEPKEVMYQDEFAPLDKVGILLGQGLTQNDPRIKILTERITRYGGKTEFATSLTGSYQTFLVIGNTDSGDKPLVSKTVPAKPEGYLLDSVKRDGKCLVSLKGHDFHGLLWAIQSFNQLVTNQDRWPLVRLASIVDYPDAPGKRGYSAFHDDDNATAAWFGVTCLRANVIVYRQLRALYRRMPRRPGADNWRTPLRDDKVYLGWQDRIMKIGSLLTPLRIPWYDSLQPLSSIRTEDLVRSQSEEDFQLVVKAGMALAEAGGNLCLLYDDFRFPMHPDDVRNFGTAREADIYFLNKIYSAVSAKYPKFKMLFCPPFYWGPGSDVSSTYGEPRDEYLAALGKRLPQAIEIYWTGPRVKSNRITANDLRWITGLIQRKPVYWQNTAGSFHGDLFYVYPTDCMTAWKDWYPEGFYDQLSFHTYNDSDPYTSLTLSAAMWNRRAYDPATVAVEAAKTLVGPEGYPKLVEVCKALEALDAFGWFTPTALAARNVEQVRKQTEKLERLFAAAPVELKHRWLPLSMYVAYKKRYLDTLLKNPQLKDLTAADDKVKEQAAREVAADPRQGDIILTPNDFHAGRSARYYASPSLARRYVLWINGARSKAPSMEASFRLSHPPTGDFELVIAGLDHNARPPCRIRIQANGKTVFEGPNPFAVDRWTTHAFRVRGDYLHDLVNSLTLVNLEDSESMTGAPWFMLHYAVLRPKKR